MNLSHFSRESKMIFLIFGDVIRFYPSIFVNFVIREFFEMNIAVFASRILRFLMFNLTPRSKCDRQIDRLPVCNLGQKRQ